MILKDSQVAKMSPKTKEDRLQRYSEADLCARDEEISICFVFSCWFSRLFQILFSLRLFLRMFFIALFHVE